MSSLQKSDNPFAVAITGVGAVSAYGTGVDAFYRGLMSSQPVIKAIELPGAEELGSVWWSEVTDFSPLDWMNDKVRDGSDVVAQWALAAAEQAITQSELNLNPLRTAVVQGTSLCGVQSLMRAQFELDKHGPSAYPRKTMMRVLTNMGAAQIAMRHDLHGPNLTVATACASALDAIGTAARLIVSGQADAAIAGGTEAGHSLASSGADDEFTPAMLFAPAMFGMQSDEEDVTNACRPFDVNRSGIATSEGSTGFVLERVEHANARGAEILGYVLGYSSLSDAYHPSAPNPSGQWEALAMKQALEESGLGEAGVDCLYAHATGTPVGDTPEIRAINRIYGSREDPLPVTSVKGHFGHAAAASGGLSLIAGLYNMGENIIVNTANTTDVDPEARFDVVLAKPRALEIDAFQVNSFGFGGQNASIVVSRYPR